MIMATTYVVVNAWVISTDLVLKCIALLQVQSSYEQRVRSYLKATQTHNCRGGNQSRLYEDINASEFRLFVLEPGIDGKIEGHFILEARERLVPPPYEALSYHWGSKEDQAIIVCNGHEMKVRQNLYDALVELRLPHAPRLLWCDALCINQENNEEKNQQVRHMNSIYESAHRVLIFLGAEADDIKGAFTLLRYMHSSAEYTARRKFDFITHFLPTSYTAARSLGQEGISESAEQACWNCANALLCRPWFHRLWVLQEVLHARKATIFTSRTNEMDWDHFVIAMQSLHRIPAVDKKLFKRAAAASHMAIEIQKARKKHLYGHYLHESDRELPFFHMLLMASSSDCEKARDRIFAVLHLANDLDSSDLAGLLAPDYSNEITADEVYRRFAEWSIKQKRNLNILSCANATAPGQILPPFRWIPVDPGATYAVKRRLPSWIPDWRNIPNQDIFVRYSENIPFSAGLPGLFGSRMDPKPEVRGNSLLLSAKRVDVVHSTKHPDLSMAESHREGYTTTLFNIFKELRDQSKASTATLDDSSVGMFEGHNKVWKMMICGLTCDGYRASRLYYFHFDNWARKNEPSRPHHRRRRRGRKTGRRQSEGYLREQMKQGRGYYWYSVGLVEKSLQKWSSQRIVGFTAKRRMCWLPPGTRPGDAIYVIPGCQVPYVFRPWKDGTYTLVGEAYVHGIMWGKARPKKASELERITIV